MTPWQQMLAARLMHSPDLDDMAEALDDPAPVLAIRVKPPTGQRPGAEMQRKSVAKAG